MQTHQQNLYQNQRLNKMFYQQDEQINKMMDKDDQDMMLNEKKMTFSYSNKTWRMKWPLFSKINKHSFCNLKLSSL